MSAEHSRPQRSPLLEQTRQLMRARHLSIRTEEAYLRRIEEFLRYHRDQQGEWVHPGQMGNAEISAYLTHLAVTRKVAASTQNQAFSALLFLDTQVLQIPVQIDAVRAQRPERLPVVLSAGWLGSTNGSPQTSVRVTISPANQMESDPPIMEQV